MRMENVSRESLGITHQWLWDINLYPKATLFLWKQSVRSRRQQQVFFLISTFLCAGTYQHTFKNKNQELWVRFYSHRHHTY